MSRRIDTLVIEQGRGEVPIWLALDSIFRGSFPFDAE